MSAYRLSGATLLRDLCQGHFASALTGFVVAARSAPIQSPLTVTEALPDKSSSTGPSTPLCLVQRRFRMGLSGCRWVRQYGRLWLSSARPNSPRRARIARRRGPRSGWAFRLFTAERLWARASPFLRVLRFFVVNSGHSRTPEAMIGAVGRLAMCVGKLDEVARRGGWAALFPAMTPASPRGEPGASLVEGWRSCPGTERVAPLRSRGIPQSIAIGKRCW